MSVCRTCRAPIEWAVTQLGAKMPLDHGLHPDGRVVVIGRARGQRTPAPLVMVLSLDELERGREHGELALRRSHFQSCPDADSWRQR